MKKLSLIITTVCYFFAATSPLANVAAPDPIPTETPTVAAIDWRDYYAENKSEWELITACGEIARTAVMICPDGSSKECLSAVMCCIYNRSRLPGFPNSITEVCSQPGQWEVKNATNNLRTENLTLAKSNLLVWTSGETHYLPIPSNMVFMVADDTARGFWFRSQWDGENEVFISYF